MNTLMPLTRMFDAALHHSQSCEPRSDWTLTPRADIIEGEKEFQIAMDLPGVKSSDLEIEMENQMLKVKAQREYSVPEGFQNLRRERPSHSSFARSFSLGSSVDAEKISAKLEDGVLWMTLPKSDKSLSRKIEVKQG